MKTMSTMKTRVRPLVPAALAAAVQVDCGGGSDDDGAALNTKPAYLGAISEATYDGMSNDLLTAGLGSTGARRWPRVGAPGWHWWSRTLPPPPVPLPG